MKPSASLTIASLLSIVLMTFHMADDVVLGFESGRASLFAVPVLAIWLYGTLVLAERRSGYVIILLGSLVGLLAGFLHLRGMQEAAAAEVARSGKGFFFLWTLIALGVTALFSVVLSARELLRVGRGQARRP